MLDENGIAWLESATRASVPAPSGALVVEVIKGGGATAAGLRPYDLLVSLERQQIGSKFDLAGFMSGRRVGQRLNVVFYRMEQGTFGRAWRKKSASVKIGIVR